MIKEELSDKDAYKIRDDLVNHPSRWVIYKDSEGRRYAWKNLGYALHTPDLTLSSTCYIEERQAEYRYKRFLWFFMRHVRVPVQHTYDITVVAGQGTHDTRQMTSSRTIESTGITCGIDQHLLDQEHTRNDRVRQYMEVALSRIHFQ